MTRDDLEAVRACLANAEHFITNPQALQRLSHDFYWYSPVLKHLLDNKVAEAVVQPTTRDEVVRLLSCCHARAISVTARGAGTGNYGQAVPLHGGVVLDLSRMDKLDKITPDGVAIAEPGLRLGALENAAREAGWELRCYPSTIAKATLGGFLGGGSGGIGSVAHGALRDFQTVRAIEIVTMEAKPRILLHEGRAVHEILHAWGTNGIITRVHLALTPAVAWAQCAVSFSSFEQAFDFGRHIADDAHWIKRLVTVFEWPIPSAFTPVRNIVIEGQALIFFMIAADQLEELQAAAVVQGGKATLAAPYNGLRTQPLLSDYTWNHTTLWAIKQDSSFTYLQCGFSATNAHEQLAWLKQKFGDDILFHIEFMKNGEGVTIPASIPLVRFTTEARLNEMIDYCRSINVSVANPHNNNVEGGGRYLADNLQLLAKHKYDPDGFLNPGKMITFEPKPQDASTPISVQD